MKTAIQSQYYAALEMMRQSVVKCPQSLWLDATAHNQYWHVAYHALFFTHLYLQPERKDFVTWAKHRVNYQDLGPEPGSPQQKAAIGEPYTPAEILEYLELCRHEVAVRIAGVDLEAPSGFHWLPMNKLELQFYNLRHLHQHIGEISGRLLVEAHVEIDWVARKGE